MPPPCDRAYETMISDYDGMLLYITNIKMKNNIIMNIMVERTPLYDYLYLFVNTNI
jgi:hypothetical protein